MAFYHLFIDIQGRRLVSGLDSTADAVLRPFPQGDTPSLVLHALEPDTAPGSLSFYKEVPFPLSGLKAGISRAIDAPPKGGGYKLRVVGTAEKSTEISASIDKSDFAAKLNAMASVTALGGITVEPGSAANLFIVKWVNPALTTLFEVVDNRLTPKSFGRVYPYVGDEGNYQIIKVFVAPFAFTDQFALPSPAELVIAHVRVGSASQNAVQSIRIPAGATGQAALKFASLSSVLIPVVGMTPALILSALNGIIVDGSARFAVSQPGANLFYVEFIGPLDKTAQNLLEVAMFNQGDVLAPVGKLALTSPALEVIQNGERSFAAFIEITGMADGSEETLIQQGVVMLNDMLDGQMALNVPGWLTSATEAASVSDPTVPIISGTLSHSVVIGNDVARIFTIDHDLGTTYPIVEVYTVSPFRRVPDNEYTTEIDDNAHVTLTFAVAVAAASLRVVIVNVEAQTVLNEHHHPIEEVDGLQDALDELAATFSTFEIATPLPLGMIPKLPWSKIGFPNVNSVNPVVIPDALLPTNIPRVDSSGFLPITTIPPEVPRLDAAGNLVVGVRGADGTITTKTILNVTTGSFDQSVIDRLVQDLANNAGFAEALISALALSGRTPPGITPMLIPDFELVYPPPRLIANAAGGAVRTYAPFPRAVGGPTSAGDVTGLIPLPDGTKKYYSVVGSAFSETNKGQRGQRFNNGDRVISDGVILYQGTSIIDAYYPAVFEREFFSLHVNPELLDVASKFFLSFTVNLQLEGNVAGACFVMLEIGEYVENAVTGTISAITWSEVFRHNIRLGPAAVVHYFDYAVTRSAGGVLTAKSTRYAKVNAAAVCPASASFAVRARLTEVDVDDTAPEPRGCLTCKVVGARATVSALS